VRADPLAHPTPQATEIAMSAHPSQSTEQAAGSPAQSGVGLVIAGYVFALVIPIVGLVLGIVTAKKHNGVGTNHGVWIVSLSVLSFIASAAIIAAAGSSA